MESPFKFKTQLKNSKEKKLAQSSVSLKAPRLKAPIQIIFNYKFIWKQSKGYPLPYKYSNPFHYILSGV